MRNLLILIMGLWSFASHAVDASNLLAFHAYFDYEKFSAALPMDICEQYIDHAWLQVPLDYANASDGRHDTVFYYRLNPFDPKKPTMLVPNGGPGLVLFPKTISFANLTDSFNIISYHSRGTGCGAVPINMENDQYISLEAEVNDLDEIRKSLHLEKWDVIHGVSAGSSAARAYASRFPSRVGKVILEGVAGDDNKDMTAEQIAVLSKQMWDGFVSRQRITLLSSYSDSGVADLGARFINFMGKRSAAMSAIVMRSLVKPELVSVALSPYLADLGPDAVSEMPFVLTYFGATPDYVDYSLAEYVRTYDHSLDLAGDVNYYKILEESINKQFFPTGKMPEDQRGYLMAWRMLFLMDEEVPVTDTCHAVPQMILQGKQDMATLANVAGDIFNSTTCYSGASVYVENAKTGHFGTFSDECEAEMIKSFVFGKEKFTLSEACASPDITVQQREATKLEKVPLPHARPFIKVKRHANQSSKKHKR